MYNCQRFGCGLIRNIACGSSDLRELLVARRCFDHLYRAMVGFPRHQDIQSEAVTALLSMTADDAHLPHVLGKGVDLVS